MDPKQPNKNTTDQSRRYCHNCFLNKSFGWLFVVSFYNQFIDYQHPHKKSKKPRYHNYLLLNKPTNIRTSIITPNQNSMSQFHCSLYITISPRPNELLNNMYKHTLWIWCGRLGFSFIPRKTPAITETTSHNTNVRKPVIIIFRQNMPPLSQDTKQLP